MLAHVVDTLRSVPAVKRVVVLAQDRRVMDVLETDVADFSQSSSGISGSIAGVAGSQQAPWPVLVTTADHPLLTPEIVTAFLAGSGDCDLAVGMVERRTLEASYPGNARTWLKLRDGQWTGANLFALRNANVRSALRLWSQVEQDRKRALRLFRRFGLFLFLRALTRTIGMKEGLALAGSRLGLKARLVDLPFAQAAIDVDKPSDHTQVEEIFLRR